MNEMLAVAAALPHRARHKDFLELTKPRITSMVAITTAAGFYLGSAGPILLPQLGWAVFGTALVSAGACALNHVIESDLDSRMHRTKDRPIPTRRVRGEHATLYAVVLALAGVAVLWSQTNLLTAVLAAACFLLYLFVYTPLKTRTTANTLVGAVAGAIPPVMGFTAASNTISVPAAIVFGILFLWQLPHFFAIASLYRDDYAAAGFRMLPVVDTRGGQTAIQTLAFTLALIIVAALPSLLGAASMLYLLGSLALGGGFLAFGIKMAWNRNHASARHLLLASVIYLPLLLTLLVLDKAAS